MTTEIPQTSIKKTKGSRRREIHRHRVAIFRHLHIDLQLWNREAMRAVLRMDDERRFIVASACSFSFARTLAYHDFADHRSVTMHLLSTRFRYGAVAQVLHWLTAVLVIAAYFLGPGGSEQRVYSSAADFTRQTHETLGIAVFALVFLRLLWRSMDSAPEDPPR